MSIKQDTMQQLIYEVKDGNTKSQIKIVNHYIELIRKIIEEKYNHESLNKDDLIQAGCLGLSIAIKNYKKDSNTPFSMYVRVYIERYISREIRNINNSLKKFYIRDSFYDFTSNIESKKFVENILKKLNEKYRKVLILHLYEGYSFVEIGKIYNLTSNRIQQIYKKSLEIVKKDLTSESIDKKKIKKQSKSI